MPKPGCIRRNQAPRSAEKLSIGSTISPRPVASAGLVCRKNGTSDPSVAAILRSCSGTSGSPNSSFNPSNVVAALPLPPPKPAAKGSFFSRCSPTPSRMPAASRNIFAARKTRLRESVGRAAQLQVKRMLCPDRSNLSRSNTATGCITVSNSWKPSARRPRIFSRRFTLQSDCFSRLSVRRKSGSGCQGAMGRYRRR